MKVIFIVEDSVVEKEITTEETIKDIEKLLYVHLNNRKLNHVIHKSKFMLTDDKRKMREVFKFPYNQQYPMKFVCVTSKDKVVNTRSHKILDNTVNIDDKLGRIKDEILVLSETIVKLKEEDKGDEIYNLKKEIKNIKKDNETIRRDLNTLTSKIRPKSTAD